jgi:hypothetical protein
LSDSDFRSLPIRDSDKLDAARKLVALVVEGRAVPGFEDAQHDAEDYYRSKTKRFFITCEFIPPEVSLSGDPRVHRITAQEKDEIFKKHGFDDTYYMNIALMSEAQHKVAIDFSFIWGPLAARGFQFEFHRKAWGLWANGQLVWLS